MNFNDAEKIIDSGTKRPIKTLIAIFILILLAGLLAFVQQYCGEKAKQASVAESSKDVLSTPSVSQSQKKHTDQKMPTSIVEQHTEGEQSPNIISGGDVKLNFDIKEKGKE